MWQFWGGRVLRLKCVLDQWVIGLTKRATSRHGLKCFEIFLLCWGGPGAAVRFERVLCGFGAGLAGGLAKGQFADLVTRFCPACPAIF
ncbi:MAG: hypothetical protein ACJA2X_000896 [Halocynthiibacter sp.]|jgi:hypothetical protein